MGIKQLMQAVEERLDESILDQRVDELLRVIFDTHAATAEQEEKGLCCEKHHDFARKAAAQSIVLLKMNIIFFHFRQKKQ